MNIAEPILWYVVFLFSTTFHEAAHSWAAKIGGDPTAYEGGQMSLDPIPHIKREKMGMVVLPIISLFLMGWPFGYASAPYDPVWANKHPHRAAWMALAGPSSNLLLVLLSIGLIWIGIILGYFSVPESISFTHIIDAQSGTFTSSIILFLSIFFSLNLILAVLNIFPLPPLDGSSAIALFVSRENAIKLQNFMNNPSFALIGLLIAWQIFEPIFDFVFLGLINLIYPGSYS